MPYHPWIFCPECGKKLTQENDGEDIHPFCGKCKRFYYYNPPPVVAALAVNSNGELLAVKRGIEPAKGEWCFVCGFMELLETPEQAVARELLEESGLQGLIIRLLGAYYEESERLGSVIVLGYEVKVDGVPHPGSDALDASFFQPGKLPRLAFKSHRKMLEVYRDSCRKI